MLCDLVETGQVFLGFTLLRVWLLFSVFYCNNSGSMPAVLAKHRDG